MMPAGPRPLVIAHRGGTWPGVPGEQTGAHVERAIAAGVDLVEVDLRRTADGHIVCHHDPDLAGLPVAEATADRLAAHAREAGRPPPMHLSELLDRARGRVRLDLEVKVGGFEAALLQQIRAGFGLDRVVFKSFEDAVVRRLKQLEPGCTAGLLLGRERARWGGLSRLGELFPGLRVRRCHADFVSPHFRLLRLGFVRRQRRAGRPVLVWTVNEPDRLRRLAPVVDGLITDRPLDALAARGG